MSTIPEQKNALTVTDVAEILNVNEESVRRWIRENKLAADKKLGRAGHTIYLDALIDFANRSSATYLNKLKAWLQKENIYFEVTEKSGIVPTVMAGVTAGVSGALLGPVGALAGGITGYGLGNLGARSKITLKEREEPQEQAQGEVCAEQIPEAADVIDAGSSAMDFSSSKMAIENAVTAVLKAELQERIQRKQSEIVALRQELEMLEQKHMELLEARARLELQLRMAYREMDSCSEEMSSLKHSY